MVKEKIDNIKIILYIAWYYINKIMNNRTGKKSIVNENIFKSKSEFSEYFIGLMCTDGYMGKSDYTIQISLKDKEILNRFSTITNIPIYERLDKRFNSKLYSYRFRNKSLYRYFESIGITNCKTKTIELLIPFTPNILRGVFDGDGCISKINNNTGNKISIVSASKKFIIQIQEYLIESGIKMLPISYYNNIYSINIYKKSEVLKFYNLIYKDATLYIKRKYIKFNAV